MTNFSAWRLTAAAFLFPLALAIAADERLTPVPEPDLATLEPSVREALLRARSGFQEASLQAEGDEDLGDVYGELGAWYQVHGLSHEARAAYRNAVTLAPLRFEWQYLLASVHDELEDVDAAMAGYSRAIEIAPSYAPALVRRARLHRERGDTASAVVDLERAQILDDSIPAVHAELGHARLADGELESAIRAFERALELDPNASALYGPLAQAHRELGDADKARQLLARHGQREAALPDPAAMSLLSLSRSSEHYFQLGMAHAEAGAHVEAAQLIGQAIELRPDYPAYYRALGEQLYQAGNFAAARQALGRAVELEPGSRGLLQNIGVVEFEMGEFAAAAASFARAIELGADSSDVRILKARARMMAGGPGAAIAQLDELAAASGQGDALEARYWLGMALLLDGQCDPAQNLFRQLWDQSGERHGSALMALVRVRATCVQSTRAELDEAVEWAELIYQALPAVETLETLAMAYAATGRGDEAVETQALAVFEAHRGNLVDRFGDLATNMDRYANGQKALRPFAANHHVLTRLE
ncbi:MAG: tetratricopeptide repeat protein [Wenzhouxiangella sp.]